jgi:hypothetical protein
VVDDSDSSPSATLDRHRRTLGNVGLATEVFFTLCSMNSKRLDQVMVSVGKLGDDAIRAHHSLAVDPSSVLLGSSQTDAVEPSIQLITIARYYRSKLSTLAINSIHCHPLTKAIAITVALDLNALDSSVLIRECLLCRGCNCLMKEYLLYRELRLFDERVCSR